MRIIGSTWGCLKKAERCWGHPRGRWMRTGVAPMQFALLMPAVAPTSNSYMHTDRCPPPLAGDKHGSLAIAIVVRLGDVRGRAHLKQPLAH